MNECKNTAIFLMEGSEVNNLTEWDTGEFIMIEIYLPIYLFIHLSTCYLNVIVHVAMIFSCIYVYNVIIIIFITFYH